MVNKKLHIMFLLLQRHLNYHGFSVRGINSMLLNHTHTDLIAHGFCTHKFTCLCAPMHSMTEKGRSIRKEKGAKREREKEREEREV